MSFIQFNKNTLQSPVNSTTHQEKTGAINQEISQSFLFLNDGYNKAVISTAGIKLLIEREFSSSFLRIRNNRLKLSLFISIISILSVLPFFGFSQNAKRVISLAPSITENLYLIGAQNKLVGCTSFCTQAIADGKEQIGSTVDINIEKILMLKPDLVLGMLLTKPQDIETLKRLGIKVEVIPTPKTFEEICSQTIQIAKMVGSENIAKELVQKSKHTVDSLKQQIRPHSVKPKIFFQLGSNPIFTVLENTFMNDFILLCNGENIANGLTKGSVTRESVLLKNPDVIIVATMGGFGAEEQKVWKSYAGLKAGKNNKIFLIDSETACSPTPINFVKAFSDVVKFVNQ
jgi:ABC-type Fe3+-hydroxamate transport system substrate-binding protein